MHESQLASEGKLRYDPMDKCGGDLLRTLPLLSLQTTRPSVFMAILSDIPATILFAAARAESSGPIRSQFFQHITGHVSLAQQVMLEHHDLLDRDLRTTILDDLRDCGTPKYKAAITEDATRLSALSALTRAASKVILLTLAFIEEWSDVQSGVDILDGCSPLADSSPFVEEDEDILRIGLTIANKLSVDEKRQLVHSMPYLFSFHETRMQVICSEDFDVQKERFDTRAQKRL